MAAQAKDLQIDFNFPDDFTITADESRITQVVENFATNAIKYAPTGGHISVTIQTDHSSTSFHIENDSEPLSSEALSKVWDTFTERMRLALVAVPVSALLSQKALLTYMVVNVPCAIQNQVVEFGFTIYR